MRLKIPAALSLACLPFIANEADASGFMIRENSAEGVGMIFAGNASRADEAATVFNNPAGMMHLAGPEIEIGAAVALPSVHFSGSATAAGVIPIPGDQGGQPGQDSVIPNLFAVFGITDNVRAGIALTVPFGNSINYGAAFVGRYSGIKTVVQSADINPNVAWRINDKVSIGGGISAQWFKTEFLSAVPQFLILKNPMAPDATFLFNGSNWAVGYNVGALLEPNNTTRLGFTYRSGVSHKLTGTLNFSNISPLIGLTSGLATGSGFNQPGTAAVSFTHDWSPAWSASAELQHTSWSSVKDVVLTSANPSLTQVEHYRDTWMFSAGAVYHPMTQLAVRAGLGWDESPTTNKYRTTGLPESNLFMLGAGAGYTFARGVVLDIGYSHYFGSDPTVTGSVNSIDPVTHAVVLSGKYHNHLDYAALSLRVGL